jgi:Ca-activated chloride channel family protein
MALLILATSMTSLAQPAAVCGPAPKIPLATNLVLINALVTDRHGTPLTNLNQQQFHIFEAGIEQEVKFCAQEDVPASIGIVLDTSGSMGTGLELLKAAAMEFLRAGNPADEYLLVQFRDRPKILVPFTSDGEQLTAAIRHLQAGGSTALLDAVYLTVQEVQRAKKARKAVLVISDGLENHSRYTDKDVNRLVSEVDFPIYAVNVRRNPGSGNRFSIQQRDPGILESISTETGGKIFTIMGSRELASVLELVASEIRHEYVLGYISTDEAERSRRVHIKIDPLRGQVVKLSYRQKYRNVRAGS